MSNTKFVNVTDQGNLSGSRYSESDIRDLISNFAAYKIETEDRIKSLEKKTATMTTDATSVIFSNKVVANALRSTSGHLSLSDGWIERPPGSARGIELNPNWKGYAWINSEGHVGRSCMAHAPGC